MSEKEDYTKDVGETGPAGATGDTGPAGDTGATGQEGPQGDQGIQGPQGDQGIQGEVGQEGPPGTTTWTGITDKYKAFQGLIAGNWTIRTSAADNGWRSVCWSPELTLFVAVANSGTGNRVMTSPDGINWTIRTSAADNSWLSVCWSPELTLFVAVAYTGTGNRVMTSLFFGG